MRGLLKKGIVLVLFSFIFFGIAESENSLAAESDFQIDEKGVLVKYSGSDAYVVIPDAVTSIGAYAFQECKNLINISIPNSVTSLGEGAFYSCSNLVGIDIPDSITVIGNTVFSHCVSLVSIDIPNSISAIGNNVFSHCYNLTSVNIPDSVTTIGTKVFFNCANLQSINVSDSNQNYKDEDGVLFNNAMTELIAYPIAKNGIHYIIPDSVIRIDNSAFYGCKNLITIIIPDSITSIADSTFTNCFSLTNINIPNFVTSIGNDAFYGCLNLTNIYIPDSVVTIGRDAFFLCTNLQNINVSDFNLNYKDENDILFNKAGTELIVYPIAKNNTHYIVPDSVIRINNSAFYGCKNLISIIIPNSVTTLDDKAFYSCISLTNINLSDSITSIGDYVFTGCTSLTSITIPDSVTSIGNGAFSYCISLTSITIPDSVTSIEGEAFQLCDKLESVFICNPTIRLGSIICGGNNTFVTLYAHKGSTTEAYALQNGYKFRELEDPNKPLITISLSKTNIVLAVGKSTLNSVIYNPVDTTDDKTIQWFSSDSGVAIVFSNGKIHGVSKGSAIITAKVGNLTATCNVTIN